MTNISKMLYLPKFESQLDELSGGAPDRWIVKLAT